MARRMRSSKRSRRTPTRSHARPNATGIIKINRRGYGFVTTAEGDYFIPAKYVSGAMDGDTVVVKASAGREGQRKTGRVETILTRAHSTVVGVYEATSGLGVITPFDSRIPFDIFTSAGAYPQARNGDVVLVRILTYPSRHESAFGQIEEVIGREDDKSIEYEVLLRKYGLESEFSEASIAQADAAKLDIEAALAEEGRRDIRDRFVFTIDPADARDFDDALSLERLEGGRIRLGVHIADVSSYVPWGSSIDLDARRRATSTYLVDRVIPMLPEKLSNELCSLNPEVDRLTMSADMIVDSAGNVVEYELFPSVIRSSSRFNYEQVQEMFDGKLEYPSPGVKEKLEDLKSIARKRFKQRESRGGVDFDTAEPKLILDAEGHVTDIYLRHRTEATGAIEEAMILANETVALFMEGITPNMVYRVHGAPSKDAIVALLPLLQELDYPTEGLLQLQPHAIQAILRVAKDRPEKDLINSRVLRSMKRAIYSNVNIGHFGLASDTYTHFTSPIRRYPDLLVHRLLRAALAGFFDEKGEFSSNRAKKSSLYGLEALKGIRAMCGDLEWLCRHSSERERAAQDAAFDSVQMKLCEHMENFIGDTFKGFVSSVSSAGLYVTLPNTVKGLIRIETLGNEYFVYDPDRQTLRGEESNTLFHIGTCVEVVLRAVSVRDITIDFALVKQLD